MNEQSPGWICFLELLLPFPPKTLPSTIHTPILLKLIDPPDPGLNAQLYREVGAPWQWRDLLGWSAEDWRAYVSQPNLHTFVAYQDTQPVGYFELLQQERDTQIAYLGLYPNFIGQGIGRWLLEQAIIQAEQLGSQRIWVHTCDLDHAAALPNYQKRGFQVYKTEPRIPGS